MSMEEYLFIYFICIGERTDARRMENNNHPPQILKGNKLECENY
jgi:hypothetical protein